MKRQTVLAFAAASWTTALVSAASLAYVLNRPLEPRLAATEVPPLPALEAPVVTSAYSPAPPAPLVLPVVTIVARASQVPRADTVAPVPASEVAPRLLDISKMACAEWRPLDMGSGRVQVCE